MQPNETTHKTRSFLARIGRGVVFLFLSVLFLIALVLLLIQTKPVQDFARKKIVSYLEQKLHTKVAIDRLDIDFPKKLVLEGIYIEDQTKDTLLAGHQLKVDIDIWPLLRNRVQVNEINLNGITVKLKRQLPDTIFNYQFIVDAFVTKEEKPVSEDTTSLIMAVEKLIIDDTRVVYFDVVTGNDVDVFLGHSQIRVARIDATKLEYDIPTVAIRGLRGHVNQNTPLAITAVNTNPDPEVTNEKPEFFKLTNRQTRLQDVDFAYNNDAAAIKTKFKFKDLQLYPKSIDLEKSLIALRKLEITNMEAQVDMNSQAEAEVIALTTQTDGELQAEDMPWKVTTQVIRLYNNSLIYNDNTQPRQKQGMDYAHLNVRNLNLNADEFLYQGDTIAVRISKGSMQEKSGFVLQQLRGNVFYTDQEARIERLYIQTPGTTIRRKVIASYPSLAAIEKNPELLELDLDIDRSRIQVKDILIFAPFLAAQPAFKKTDAVLQLNSRITGSLAHLNIRTLQFSGFDNTRADLYGTLHHATNADRFSVDLNIRNISTSRKDILLFAPPKTIPDSITLPESIALKGTVKGGVDQLTADLDLNTSLGAAQFVGNVSNAARPQKATYDAEIAVEALQVGTIIQQPETVGPITAHFDVRGKGYDLKTAAAHVKGVVNSAVYNKYTYRNLALEATLAQQQFDVKSDMKDPNLHLMLQAEGELGGTYPCFAATLNIDSIKTGPLHLTAEPMIYRGIVQADIPVLNLDSLHADVFLLKSLMVYNDQRVMMDSVELVARYENGQQSIDLKADFLQAQLNGKYKLTQLGDIFIQAVQPYYAIVDSISVDSAIAYDFTIKAAITDHPALKAFLPDLGQMDDITLDAHFSNAEGWNANLSSPSILYGSNKIVGLNLDAKTQGNQLRINTTVAEIGSGETFALLNTQVKADVENNQVEFVLRIGDRTKRDKYLVPGLFAQQSSGVYSLSLHPDSLLLNYQRWSIRGDNQIRFGSTMVNAQHFDLSQNDQHLRINSRDTSSNSPLEITFEKFQLATLTGFVQVDSLFADGTLNGNIVLNDLLTQPNFTTDLTINNLEVERDTLGDIRAKVSNPKPNVFAADVTVSGRGNEVGLTGNYYLRPEDKSTMDFILDIKKLQWKTLEGVSMGNIRDGKGYMTGKVKISNKPTSPDIAGNLGFQETSMIVTMLNSEFKIDNEQIIAVNNEGLLFNSFTVRDSAENRLTINGTANTTNYQNYVFDLNMRARNFKALNTSKKDNNLYYGKLLFDADLKIAGTEVSPVVDGSLRINEGTRLTVVVPQEQPGVVEREGIVVFVDKDAPPNDSLFLQRKDSLNTSDVQGMEVSANIEVDKNAELNLVIDEGNGDFLRLQGEAVLNGGIDKSGKITLTGSYELEAGAYEMSFNFLNRRFDIQKGSKITWIGEPTNAIVDITAVYVANTSAVELIQDQITAARSDLRYRQKLPFEVFLNMDGPLMQPILTFDITLPEESTVRIDNEIAGQVEMRLNQLKAEPSELNKQVFALLLLNRFVSENPFESAGGLNAETLARQSVSKILTEQLNNLAGDLIAGVDLNFDVVSTEDYTSGNLQNKTDLNIGVSKRLLNDRLNVSIGTNFELEGGRKTNETGTGGGQSASPNLNVEYFLTQDGRYLLRAYRRNEYEGVVEGYVVETGIGFVLSVDYDKFKEIFEARKLRRGMNQERRRMEKGNPPPEKPANPPLQEETDSGPAFIDINKKEEDEE